MSEIRYRTAEDWRDAQPLTKALLASTQLVTSQSHYNTLAPEPITVMEGWTHLSLRMQLALKYLARIGLKGTNEDAIRDCEKLISYVQREINARRGKPEW